MIVYVKGKTRVKGVQNKDVYYVGCVESDGYIYFNDSVSYRIPTPSTLREENDVNVTDVQIWYTVRNCWLRANYFTQLKVYGVDFEHIYNRIGTLETKVATLESKVATLESKVATLETKVYNLETTVADHEVRIVACEAQIQGLNTRLVAAESNISNLQVRMSAAETNITTNRTNIQTINNLLGPLQTFIGSGNTLADYLRDTVNGLNNRIDGVSNRVTYLENTEIPNIWRNINSILYRLDHAYTASGGGTMDMETVINTFVDGLEGVLLDISELSARDYAHKTAINELGHKALGASYSGTDGNGVTLLAVYNKVNTVIDNLNYLIDGVTIVGHVGNLPRTSVWTSWSDIPN